jgi:peptide/nickel transport system permease protein
MRARLIHSCTTVLLTVLLGGLIAATLVRRLPGFGVDEREFDPHYSQDSVRRIRQESRPSDHGAVLDYLRFLARAVTGDLGISASFHRPVAALIAERFPQTLASAGAGLGLGWVLGMLFAIAAALSRSAFDFCAGALAALLLCLPSSVLAPGVGLAGPLDGRKAAAAVVAMVIFPRVFRFARAILGRVACAPHVLMARARGVGPARLVWAHLLRPCAPAMLALLGVSVSVAFGAAIPIEVLCDSPGLGQLAWQAALKRDLPLLVDITLLVSLMAGVSGLAAEIIRPATARS